MTDNKRIAKNTLYLYMRMIILMVISFYTSRLILQVLGVVDYGIYNIVGGVVVLFAFLKTSLSGATQRFLSFSLGEKNSKKFNNVFCTAVNLHLLLGIILVLLLETIGLWFFYSKINIPEDRMTAAFWTYQISVILTFSGVSRMPYGALIIAHERMDYHAHISILEGFFKLSIVFLIPLFNFDHLIFYSILLLTTDSIMYLILITFCYRNFNNIKYGFKIDKNLFREMLDYSGWCLFGGIANIARTQGVNVLLNIYTNVVVNAAMGISTVLSNYSGMLMFNFTTAFKPQIVKLYADKDLPSFHKLIFQSSKISFILMTIIAVPVIYCIKEVLAIWLDKYPMYTESFSIIAILAIIVDSFSASLWTAIGAVGKMRNYQISMFLICMIVLPYSWLILFYGFSPIYCIFGNVIANSMMLIYRVYYLKKLTGFKAINYLEEVVLKGIICILISFLILHIIPDISENNFIKILYYTTLSILINTILFSCLFLNKNEKFVLISYLKKVIKHQ